jgi:hypothetical protein
MRLLKRVQEGQLKLVVSLFAFGVEKEQTICDSIEEAKALLLRPMAKAWHYAMPSWQWPDHLRFGEEVGEIERACGLVATCDVI